MFVLGMWLLLSETLLLVCSVSRPYPTSKVNPARFFHG